MISNVVVERAFEGTGADEVIGLQVFALKHTEPDFDLIKPGGIGRQPEHLKVQVPVTGRFLLAQPAFELFGAWVVPLSKMKITVCTLRRTASAMICSCTKAWKSTKHLRCREVP